MGMASTKYWQLVKLFRNYRKRQVALFVVCVIAVLLNLYFVYQIQEFVDMITAGATLATIWKSFVRILVIGIAALLMGIVQNRMWHTFRYMLMNQMQTMMYRKLLMKKAIFYDEHTTGEIVSAVMNDGSLIAETAGISILMFFLNSMQIIVILGVLIWKNALMGGIALVIGVVYFVLVNRINGSMRDTYKDYSQNVAEVNQHLTEDVKAGTKDVDVIYTDVWVSMGEPDEVWTERIKELSPYQVNKAVMDNAGEQAIFMHCLPAFHDLKTKIGAQMGERFGITEMEVTDEVFESGQSLVFEEAENRMHTIKAVMAATL